MTQEGFKRKLTAILSADAVGYSRLMAEDEAATVKTIATYREIISSLIKQHRGRVVDSPGDNVLAEFSSVVDAVQCAVAAQNEFRIRNAELAENRRMEFRIGINLGDVIDEDDRIYGDGVNIAARLESLADPGGICVSKTAFDQIETKLPLGYEYLGEQSVKNIPKPVRAYRVLMKPDAAGKVIGEKRFLWRFSRRTAMAAIILLVMVAVGLVGWNIYLQQPKKVEPASVEEMVYPLPERPSIAVLPFDNLSSDPQQEYFSDGLTEEIITALSNVPKIFVIARDSVFTYKGKPVKAKQVAEELGIRYVLEGSVRKSGDKIRITAQLIDALSGHHLWAERYDRDLKDIFAVQDELTKKIITAMQVELTEGEQARVDAKGTNNLQAYLKYLQARENVNKLNAESNARGKQLAQEAIDIDPKFAMAYRVLAAAHRMDMLLGTSKSPKESIGTCMRLLNKAIELDESYTEAYGALGWTLSLIGQHDKAVATAEKAVSLDPNSANTYAMLGHTLRMADRPKEAILAYTKAIRLNPIPPSFYLFGLGLSYSLDGHNEKGIEWCEKAVRQDPDSFFAHIILTAVYSMAGRDEEARAEAIEVLRINPKYSLAQAEKRAKYKYKDKMFEALRRAGLPYKPPLPLPDKPSIAVLPLKNLSGDPEQEYLSDGFTEDIITTLAKMPRMFVIARESSFTYKGKSVKTQEVGRDLGVRYVLEGSIQKSGDRIRITVQLIDAANGHHLWAEKYDRNFTDIFALKDEITKEIAIALQTKLTEGEWLSGWGGITNNFDAWLKVKQSLEHFRRFTPDDNILSRKKAKEALNLDPNYSGAMQMVAWTLLMDGLFGTSKTPEKSIEQAFELAQKALDKGDDDAGAHYLLGYAYSQRGQFEKAVSELEIARDLFPNSAEINAGLGMVLSDAGKPLAAIPVLKKAMRLNPIPPSWYFSTIGNAYRDTEQYEKATLEYKKAIQQQPDNMFAHLSLAVCYVKLNRQEDAHAEAAEVLRINPKFSVERYVINLRFKDQAAKQRYINGMRKAGLPE